jgi:phosphatidylglycerol:prolipoprotein diacylglycerol transferase
MFPYFDTTKWHVGPVAIHPFVILLALSVATGYSVTVWRAARDGVSRERVSELASWMFGVGFAGAYLMSLAYIPSALADIARHPSRALSFNWGLSSFGGFAGGLIGAAMFFGVRGIARPQRVAFLDAVGFAVPFGWSVGRIGCYLVHDHPGIRTSSWLGVRYPEGVRYDLGLLEVFFLIALGAVFLILDRKPWPPGFFRVVLFLSYGVFRILEDRLRIDPPRHFGWTVDQMAATVMMVLGLTTLVGMRQVKIAEWLRYPTSASGSGGIGLQ